MSTKTLTCAPCAHIAEDGWTGLPEGTGHCRDCHKVYQGRQVHCVNCHESFGGDEACTRHIARDGSCRAPETVLHRDGWQILTQGANGVWTRAFGR